MVQAVPSLVTTKMKLVFAPFNVSKVNSVTSLKKIAHTWFILSGCFCPAGTVELGDKCVAVDECPSTNTTAVEDCPVGMAYEECGTACPTTCDNKDELVRPCTLQCVAGKLLYLALC